MVMHAVADKEDGIRRLSALCHEAFRQRRLGMRIDIRNAQHLIETIIDRIMSQLFFQQIQPGSAQQHLPQTGVLKEPQHLLCPLLQCTLDAAGLIIRHIFVRQHLKGLRFQIKSGLAVIF